MLKRKLKDLLKNTEDKAGLYITIIFHLVVIIVLLASQLDSALKKEESFVLDFSKQEEVERLKKEVAFKEDISKRLDQLIAASRNSSEPIRNIAVAFLFILTQKIKKEKYAVMISENLHILPLYQI